MKIKVLIMFIKLLIISVISVADEHVKPVLELIRKNGRTGYRGDGMIIIPPNDEVYKVRTDESGILAV